MNRLITPRRAFWACQFAVLAAVLLLCIAPTAALAQVQIVTLSGDPAPDANGSFTFLEAPTLNDAGQAAFRGSLTGTSGGTVGIFRGDGATLTRIARSGDAAPDANGSFSGFFIPALNDAGQAAFFGALTGTSGGSSDNVGLFHGNGTTLTQIARAGDAAPDTNGSFSSFGIPALNESGQAAFGLSHGYQRREHRHLSR